jgi:acyl phosphate:glycerol-3-phosphate acyltransferase
MIILLYVLSTVIAYFIGGISIANMLSRKIIGKNISDVGSGNTGASNMIRNCGWAAGLGTLFFDAAKAVIAILIGKLIAGEIGMYLAAIFVIVGHIWPVLSGFKGGKGVASTLGAMLFLMPIPTLIIFAVSGLTTLIFKTMSITSIVGLGLMLILGLTVGPPAIGFKITVGIIFLITVLNHWKNIGRLFRGEEVKVKIESKDKQDKEEK